MFGFSEVDLWDMVDDHRGRLKEPLIPVPRIFCLDCRNNVHDFKYCSPEFCDCPECPRLRREDRG